MMMAVVELLKASQVDCFVSHGDNLLQNRLAGRSGRRNWNAIGGKGDDWNVHAIYLPICLLFIYMPAGELSGALSLLFERNIMQMWWCKKL